MIFVSGIHGVGKSFFCQLVREQLEFNTYSASSLIGQKKQSIFSRDKVIPDIDDNQNFLLEAITDFNRVSRQYLLDGHFCLLNSLGMVQRISQSTFTDIHPAAIVSLMEKSGVIADRRFKRDGINYKVEDIEVFQNEELQYAKEIATLLDISLYTSPGEDGLTDAIIFVKKVMGGLENGG